MHSALRASELPPNVDEGVEPPTKEMSNPQLHQATPEPDLESGANYVQLRTSRHNTMTSDSGFEHDQLRRTTPCTTPCASDSQLLSWSFVRPTAAKQDQPHKHHHQRVDDSESEWADDEDDEEDQQTLPNQGLQFLKTKHQKWYWWVRLRRLFTFLPGFGKHGNSFLCDNMLCVTSRILMVFMIRFFVNRSLHLYVDTLKKHLANHEDQQQCANYLTHGFLLFVYLIPVNLLLGLPALQFRRLALFRLVRTNSKHKQKHHQHKSGAVCGGAKSRMAESDSVDPMEGDADGGDWSCGHPNDQKVFVKTWLLTLCECFVMAEIPYLVFVLGRLIHRNPVNALKTCANSMAVSVFIVFVIAELLCWYAYGLRWKQIVVFHRLHEHVMNQRGFWRGNSRFKFDGKDLLDRLGSCWRSRSRQIQSIQVILYDAAKSGQLSRLQRAVQQARRLDGEDFAEKWYVPECDFDNSLTSTVRLLSKCRRNPLHVAVAFGQLDCVRFLVEQAKFDVDGYDKIELFQMDVSSFYRRVFELCFWFVNNNQVGHGRSRTVFGSVGTLLTPLHVAISLGNREIAALLVQLGANGNATAWSRHRQFCTPPLFWAVSEECVELLVLHADVNHLHVPGHGCYLTAYEVARMNGSHGIADRLQIYGGDMALTPLHDAAAKGDIREVQFYLEHGANPNSLGENCVGFFHRTPLHWAAMRGHRDVIRLLVQYGAVVDYCDVFGRTPLAWACFFRREECVEELLQSRADPNVVDAQGLPLLSICAASPASMTLRQEEVGLFRATDDQMINSARKAEYLLEGFENVLETWKGHGGDLGKTCELTGDTALHVALMNNNEQAAIALVRNGLSLTTANHAGKRAIDCATSTSIRYAVKKEAGYRDVMISYCHAHAHFAWKIRNALERAHITTWIDQMDPTGITGGAIWRQEIAQAIENSSMMLCILCEHYPESQWCMKELAYAKMTETPVLAIRCSDVEMNEEMQMYLYTRQIIDFKESILAAQPTPTVTLIDSSSSGGQHDGATDPAGGGDTAPTSEGELLMGQMECWFQYDETSFDTQLKLLLDGIHAELQAQHTARASETRALRRAKEQRRRQLRRMHANEVDDTMLQGSDLNCNPSILIADERSLVPATSGTLDLTKLMELVDTKKDDMLSVFISHGDHHNGFCQKLRKSLLSSMKRNLSVVIDVNTLTCRSRLVNCDVLIVILSAETMQSAIVADQLAFAEDHFKTIVPLMLSTFQVDPAKKYTFSRGDCRMVHFNESLGFDQSFKLLTKYLRRFSDQKCHEMQLDDQDQSIIRGSEHSQYSASSQHSGLVSSHSHGHHPRKPRKQRRAGHGYSYTTSKSSSTSSMDESSTCSFVQPLSPSLLSIQIVQDCNDVDDQTSRTRRTSRHSHAESVNELGSFHRHHRRSQQGSRSRLTQQIIGHGFSLESTNGNTRRRDGSDAASVSTTTVPSPSYQPRSPIPTSNRHDDQI